MTSLDEVAEPTLFTAHSTTLTIPPTSNNHSGTVVPRVTADAPIWLIPCYSIILLCAVLGNLLVVLTLMQNRRMRTITNVFLLNLAISDILLGVLCMPVTLVGTLLRQFIFGEFLCKLIQFAQASSVAVSSWTLVAISCERYYAICHPLRSRRWQTINHANKIIAFIWIGSLMCMTPIAAFSQLMPTSRQGLRKCREHWPTSLLSYERIYNVFLLLALLVFPLLMLSCTYTLITRTLYVSMRNERTMSFGTKSETAGHGRSSNIIGSGIPGSSLSCCSDMLTDAGGGSRSHAHIKYSCQNNVDCSAYLCPENMESTGNFCIQQQQRQQQYSYEETFTRGGMRHKLLTSYDGQRHVYSMRSTPIKSLRYQHKHNSTEYYDDLESHLQRPTRKLQQQYQVTNGKPRNCVSRNSLRINPDASLRKSNESKSLQSKKRVVKMLFVLVLEFFVCWTPLYIINTMTMLVGPVVYEYVSYTAISFLQLLAYSSSCCNPITYCFMNASFRRAFLDTFKGIRLCDGGRLYKRRSQNETNLSMAGNSIALVNSVMSNNTILESPRL